MDGDASALVETLLFFAGLLGLGFWQLHSVSQAKKRRLERERADRTQG
jgi:cytochrome oxidase assembly protein ShyY1